MGNIFHFLEFFSKIIQKAKKRIFINLFLAFLYAFGSPPKNRKITYFINCHDLILQLKRAKLENRLETRLKFFSKYKVLIIDEVGYLPIDKEGANLLFQLINKRYENSSTIITTNKPFSELGEVFGDSALASAIDRLLHHSHVINIMGSSYRLKDKTLLKSTN